MLPPGRWFELFTRAGFTDPGCRPIGSPGSQLLWTRRPETAVDLDPEALRAHAATRLPAHMVPEAVEVLPWLPLSANGKVDRSVLTADAADAAETEDEPPQGEIEQQLAELWAELLGRSVTGRHRGFFELGGDSLLATRFVEHVRRRHGVDLPLRGLFARPSLAAVASALADALAAAKGAAGDEMEEGTL
jgi:aryl carrier-like protein